MELTPFTLDEATEIWDDFEDLKDTEFHLAAIEYFVHDVVICPFHEADKAKFIQLYDSVKDGKVALEAYSGAEYDVMIVACDVADESVFSYVSIRSFAVEKGISYNFFQHS
ncbi:MAG: hypothetical protein JWQ38_3099 [Flavipsychrobacter sp.]|nr:hypothetical protein [Flavipsychrobacter sp.]